MLVEGVTQQIKRQQTQKESVEERQVCIKTKITLIIFGQKAGKKITR